MKYRVIVHPDIEELIKQVNQAISEGWIPLGGIAYGMADRRHGFAQAMTKDEKGVTQ